MTIIAHPTLGERPAAPVARPVPAPAPAVTQAERNDPLALARAVGVVAASSR
ncbi:hypothetical protein AB6N23_01880 [Cellulomonas sp. 179-A 9B4 NHS]|uniref:hypothetical protein n=1 Tax=Cellulomonas sp. 179-A 9B4 NHS TaxID=3142379 RepID=UPI0039A31901